MPDDDRVAVYLTRGHVAYVSPQDAEWVRRHKWHYNGDRSPYAARRARGADGKRRKVYLHREILKAPRGMVVHHKDGDTMNCTRGNLAVIRQRTNSSSAKIKKSRLGVLGVSLRPGMREPICGTKCFRVRLRVGEKELLIGHYYTLDEACLAYDRAAVTHMGLHADTNYPLENYICPGIRYWGYPSSAEAYTMQDIPF